MLTENWGRESKVNITKIIDKNETSNKNGGLTDSEAEKVTFFRDALWEFSLCFNVCFWLTWILIKQIG